VGSCKENYKFCVFYNAGIFVTEEISADHKVAITSRGSDFCNKKQVFSRQQNRILKYNIM
jgi:hypothetical protein